MAFIFIRLKIRILIHLQDEILEKFHAFNDQEIVVPQGVKDRLKAIHLVLILAL